MNDDKIALLKDFHKLEDIFYKLYNLENRKNNYSYYINKEIPPKRYNGFLYPYRFLKISCGIEVEIDISRINRDIKHEEDDYAHALSLAALKYYNNLECELSVVFHDIFIKYLFDKKMFFEDIKKFVYPFEVYENGKGELRNFLFTSFSEDSFFSYQFFIRHIFAYHKKDDMFLSYNDEILISNDDFRDFMTRLEIEMNKLRKIYTSYYEDVISKLYLKTDKYIFQYMRIDGIMNSKKQGPEDIDFDILNELVSSYNDLNKEYLDFLNKENIKEYIYSKLV